jgi:hypothetical protein
MKGYDGKERRYVSAERKNKVIKEIKNYENKTICLYA